MHRNEGDRGIVRVARSRRNALWLTVGIAAFVAASAWSAAMTLTAGPGEWAAASGSTWTPVSHLVTGSLGVGTVPHPIPGLVSASPEAPTELPAGSTAYLLDGRGTSGNASLDFTINETAGQGANEEFELEFTLNVSQGGEFRVSAVDVFIETQTSTTSAPYSFTFVDDLEGANGLGSVRASEVIVACPAEECP
jgi:hypothetical protein